MQAEVESDDGTLQRCAFPPVLVHPARPGACSQVLAVILPLPACLSLALSYPQLAARIAVSNLHKNTLKSFSET